MSQSLKYGGFRYSKFANIQTLITFLFPSLYQNVWLKKCSIMLDIFTFCIAFPFKNVICQISNLSSIS